MIYQDFTGQQIGTMKIVGRLESAHGVRWLMACTQCNATGATASNEEVAQRRVKCKSSSCGVTSRETRREPDNGYQGGGYATPRERLQAKQRATELATLETPQGGAQ